MKRMGMFPPVLLALLLLVAMTGCDKVSKEAIAMFKSAEFAAKERAAAWIVIAPDLASKAITPEANKDVETWAKHHGDGLMFQANGLAELVDGLEKKPKLLPETKKALLGAAQTARSRVDLLKRKMEVLTARKPEDAARIETWLKAHLEALTKQADTLDAINKQISPNEVVVGYPASAAPPK